MGFSCDTHLTPNAKVHLAYVQGPRCQAENPCLLRSVLATGPTHKQWINCFDPKSWRSWDPLTKGGLCPRLDLSAVPKLPEGACAVLLWSSSKGGGLAWQAGANLCRAVIILRTSATCLH